MPLVEEQLGAREGVSLQFGPAGLRKHKKREKPPKTLETTRDWHIMVDLPEIKYRFTIIAAVTTKRPDLVLWSAARQLIPLLELTVPAERNAQQAYDRKLLRYDGPGALASDCRDAGWQVEVMPVEVGTLGFIADSTRKALTRLGAWSEELRTTLEEVALRASYALYIERKPPGWSIGKWRLWRPPQKAAAAEEAAEETDG